MTGYMGGKEEVKKSTRCNLRGARQPRLGAGGGGSMGRGTEKSHRLKRGEIIVGRGGGERLLPSLFRPVEPKCVTVVGEGGRYAGAPGGNS